MFPLCCLHKGCSVVHAETHDVGLVFEEGFGGKKRRVEVEKHLSVASLPRGPATACGYAQAACTQPALEASEVIYRSKAGGLMALSFTT